MGKPDPVEWDDLLEDDDGFAYQFLCVFDNSDVPEEDEVFDPDYYNHYLNMELLINRGG